MNRPRLAAGLALAALAGWWARQAAADRPEPARTAFLIDPTVMARLRRSEWCPGCGHRGGNHDPDLGCLFSYCPCRRLRCLCPPGDR